MISMSEAPLALPPIEMSQESVAAGEECDIAR